MGETVVAHRPVETNRGEIVGWAMYDWANSAFSTIVVTALFGPYIQKLGDQIGGVTLLGQKLNPGSYFTFVVAASVILQVLLLPVLGTIADYSSFKKRLMLIFAIAGAISTMLMVIIKPDLAIVGTNGAILLAGLLFIIANLSFGAAVVLYNAFLPDIAKPKDRDRISSFGWALGYLGGGIALAIALGIFFCPL